ncbi:deoxyribodipyrimidine photo-lyase [Acuticoccus sp.]|uniref:deoxyribodipyrimidine photo-lyase n=1 Tax=Acuticoccus sp. TaxID=1904378 RepID=UPI003B52677F
MSDALQRRTSLLNDGRPRNDGRYVLYWMEHAQRADDNPALERAVIWANSLKLPLLVLFVVDPAYPEGNARHFTFMLEGLQETLAALRTRGAHPSLRRGSPAEVAAQVGRDAAVVVTDRGYLRHLVEWRGHVAHECGCLMEMVEGEAIVPVEAASQKQESAARTLRPRIHKAKAPYLDLPPTVALKTKAKGLASKEDLALDDVASFVEELGCDASVAPVDHTKGGPSRAAERLRTFITEELDAYGDGRSDIVHRHVSVLSPYLHLGQISPLTVYHRVAEAQAADASKDAYIEEMLVRRELAINFVHYNKRYDAYESLPAWARETLEEHKGDERARTYTRRELEAGRTDDLYWNAAMREMRLTGYLHNYMRMYWGKRIIAYSKSPKAAYTTTLELNNKYFLDGRDANSYANVSWLFGLHDRGWPERDVYGKVRTMTASGLKRKFDVDAYVRWAEGL